MGLLLALVLLSALFRQLKLILKLGSVVAGRRFGGRWGLLGLQLLDQQFVVASLF